MYGAALADFVDGLNFFPDDRATLLSTAEAALTKALPLAPEHADAHMLLGAVQINTNRAAQGISQTERALTLNPNLASAHMHIGLAKCFIGRAQETEAHINKAIRLSPRDTGVYIWLAMAGYAKLLLSRNDEAASLLHRSIEANRNYALPHFWLAAALAHLGRLNEARAATQAGLALNPNTTVSGIRNVQRSDNPIWVVQHERLFDGMRKAGVPEG